MKKLLSFTLTTALLFSLTGCFGGIKLEENQSHLTMNKDGEITLEAIMEDRDFEDAFDVDFDDKEKDVIKDLEEYFDDEDITVEVKKLKLNKDTAEITIFIEDGEDYLSKIDETLEDLADDSGYDDIEDFVEAYDYEFVTFKDEEDIDSKDLEDYADYIYLNVYGGEEGMYYTTPSDIEAVSDLKFERINKNTIFIEDGEYGYILIKEY
ncbi:MAG: hypothetical protein JW708_09965 [Vallitaleaceae bacterium]|nr:hypothetical protein [Vallitaleaceae bacterium]